MSTHVRDNPARNRYEILSDGELVGSLAYEVRGDRIAMTHTEVDPAYSGQGLGWQLVTAALRFRRPTPPRRCTVVPLRAEGC